MILTSTVFMHQNRVTSKSFEVLFTFRRNVVQHQSIFVILSANTVDNEECDTKSAKQSLSLMHRKLK
jgi:hypothetical protein